MVNIIKKKKIMQPPFPVGDGPTDPGPAKGQKKSGEFVRYPFNNHLSEV